eukprot:Rhum_TRINITY_DN11065_c1_g1::Rhum_TRINITY_DN11065_c1_g1_i1::g.42203::m.42203
MRRRIRDVELLQEVRPPQKHEFRALGRHHPHRRQHGTLCPPRRDARPRVANQHGPHWNRVVVGLVHVEAALRDVVEEDSAERRVHALLPRIHAAVFSLVLPPHLLRHPVVPERPVALPGRWRLEHGHLLPAQEKWQRGVEHGHHLFGQRVPHRGPVCQRLVHAHRLVLVPPDGHVRRQGRDDKLVLGRLEVEETQRHHLAHEVEVLRLVVSRVQVAVPPHHVAHDVVVPVVPRQERALPCTCHAPRVLATPHVPHRGDVADGVVRPRSRPQLARRMPRRLHTQDARGSKPCPVGQHPLVGVVVRRRCEKRRNVGQPGRKRFEHGEVVDHRERVGPRVEQRLAEQLQLVPLAHQRRRVPRTRQPVPGVRPLHHRCLRRGRVLLRRRRRFLRIAARVVVNRAAHRMLVRGRLHGGGCRRLRRRGCGGGVGGVGRVEGCQEQGGVGEGRGGVGGDEYQQRHTHTHAYQDGHHWTRQRAPHCIVVMGWGMGGSVPNEVQIL